MPAIRRCSPFPSFSLSFLVCCYIFLHETSRYPSVIFTVPMISRSLCESKVTWRALIFPRQLTRPGKKPHLTRAADKLLWGSLARRRHHHLLLLRLPLLGPFARGVIYPIGIVMNRCQLTFPQVRSGELDKVSVFARALVTQLTPRVDAAYHCWPCSW